jgi:hypothetical protein
MLRLPLSNDRHCDWAVFVCNPDLWQMHASQLNASVGALERFAQHAGFDPLIRQAGDERVRLDDVCGAVDKDPVGNGQRLIPSEGWRLASVFLILPHRIPRLLGVAAGGGRFRIRGDWDRDCRRTRRAE